MSGVVSKIKNSLAYRTAGIYKRLLTFTHLRKNIEKSSLEINYITMVGDKHVPMLQQNLTSLVNNWNLTPSFTVYTDGSISVGELEKKLKHLNLHICYFSWEKCLDEFDDTSESLKSFAKKHVIGRKLLVILANAKSRTTLWCDSDILWYKQLPLEKELSTPSKLYIKASQDFQPAYSQNILTAFPQLLKEPYVNSGMVLLRGDFLKESDLTQALSIASKNPDHFSEQTIIALWVHELGKRTWPMEEIVCFQHDELTLRPTFRNKKWIARHYVGPVRHLFWRDAFFSALGIK